MEENKKAVFEDVEEEYEFLDSVEYNGDTYFMLVPVGDDEDIDGEVFVMKLVDLDGEQMLEGVDNGEIFDAVYNIFKENNKDDFEFLD